MPASFEPAPEDAAPADFAEPSEQALWELGWALLATKQPYEAHEAWETLWHGLRRSAEPERQTRGRLVRALIQLAAARHLVALGRERAAGSVLARACAGVRELLESHGQRPLLGIDLGSWAEALERAAQDPTLDAGPSR